MKHNYKMKTIGPQAAHLITTLYEENKSVFRLEDVQRILDRDVSSSRNLVRKLVDRGLATRLKPGLFILVPYGLGKEREYMGDPLVVARELVDGKDYYLSHGTAMEIHGMVTQPRLVIHVTTLDKRRPVHIMGTDFRFVTCKKEHFFGTVDHWATKQEKVAVSDMEKTIIDGLRQPEHCGGITETAKAIWTRRQNLNGERLIEYALRLDMGAVVRRLGYLMELYGIGLPKNLGSLRDHLTNTYAKLDPLLPPEGKFVSKWRLQLNVSPDELLSAGRT